MTVRNICTSLLLVFISLLSGCGSDQIAGGASEAEGKIIAGTLIDVSSNPVVNARVLLRTARDVVMSESELLPVDSTHTNETGAFQFTNVEPGEYLVDARYNQKDITALIPAVSRASAKELLPPKAMQTSARLSGNLGFAVSDTVFDYSVALLNTPYAATATTGGSFLLTGIPPDTYTAVLVVSNKQNPELRVIASEISLTVRPGQQEVLDSLPLNRFDETSGSIIDNFDHCSRYNTFTGNGLWWHFKDSRSVITSPASNATDQLMESPGFGGTGCAARILFDLADSSSGRPFAGIGTEFRGKFRTEVRSVDLSRASAIRCRVKGHAPGASVRIKISSKLTNTLNFVAASISTVPGDWTEYTVDFASDIHNTTYDLDHPLNWRNLAKFASRFTVEAIGTRATSGCELWIDDIRIDF